jgi:hexosaminidase
MNILPLPVQVEQLPGEFQLTGETSICIDEPNHVNSTYLHNLLAAPTGFPLPLQTAHSPHGISLSLNPALSGLGKEGYHLLISPQAVTLEALTPTGVFYAIQTLRQLLPASIERRQLVSGESWRIPAVEVHDWPRFPWRGFMLDEGRHFQGKEAVLQTLELMALQKLNVFHWHLTEDQGWRVQINAYPRLTEVGSQRAGTSRAFTGKHDGVPHNGFYTQEEIHQVVAYAAERHITVLPEIEIPGHSLAVLASYPELSCTGGPFEVATHFGVYPDIYCAGKEAAFTFLQNVLDEIIDLFPSPYIHIGGDEAPKKRWKACPDCQRRIQHEGLKDEHALQVYFTNRIITYLAQLGRQVVGWNQILDEGLAPDAVVQYWLGNRKRLLHATKSEQRKVVMSTYLDAYLDHSYSLMPLSRAYRYEPLPPGLQDSQSECILGLEFPLWGEFLPNQARLDYQAYPRLTAMAETAWTPKEKKDLTSFLERLVSFLDRLDQLGVGYAPLHEAEPSRLKQLFGIFTIPLPQTRTSNKSSH